MQEDKTNRGKSHPPPHPPPHLVLPLQFFAFFNIDYVNIVKLFLIPKYWGFIYKQGRHLFIWHNEEKPILSKHIFSQDVHQGEVINHVKMLLCCFFQTSTLRSYLKMINLLILIIQFKCYVFTLPNLLFTFLISIYCNPIYSFQCLYYSLILLNYHSTPHKLTISMFTTLLPIYDFKKLYRAKD